MCKPKARPTVKRNEGITRHGLQKIYQEIVVVVMFGIFSYEPQVKFLCFWKPTRLICKLYTFKDAALLFVLTLFLFEVKHLLKTSVKFLHLPALRGFNSIIFIHGSHLKPRVQHLKVWDPWIQDMLFFLTCLYGYKPRKLMGSWNLEPAKYRGKPRRDMEPKPTNLRKFQCEGSNNRKHVAIQHLLILIRIKYHLLRHYLQQHPTQAAAERAETSRQTCCKNTFLKSSATSNLEPMVSMKHNEKTHVFNIYRCVVLL